jgi:hypothetical protein
LDPNRSGILVFSDTTYKPKVGLYEAKDFMAHDLPSKAQQALDTLKRYSAGRQREELREIGQAEDLARLLARKITEDHHDALTAHSELTTSTAQEHLMQ